MAELVPASPGKPGRHRAFAALASALLFPAALSTCIADFLEPTSQALRSTPVVILVVTRQPVSTAAGSPNRLEVSVTDSAGNLAGNYSGEVTIGLASNPGAATIHTGSGGVPVGYLNGGRASITDIRIDKAGAGYTLIAAVTRNGVPDTALSVISAPFDIQPGAATRLSFQTQPATTTIARALMDTVRVAAVDAYGNVATGFADSVTLALLGTTVPLAGASRVPAVSGVATFAGMSVATTGGYSLTATAAGLTGAQSSSFFIIVGPAVKLGFTVQPGPAAAGVGMSPGVQVTIQDVMGNTVTTATDAITLALGANPGSATLGGILLTQNAAAGQVNYGGLSVSAAGIGYTLVATSGTLTAATSNAFNVAGSAAKLAFTVQPGAGTGGTALNPAVRVTVQDAAGLTVTNATNAVTLALGANPAGGALSGTLTATASAGVATFTNVRVDRAGGGYRLAASATGLTGATSDSFAIAVGAAAKIGFVVQPSAAVAGAVLNPPVQVAVQDAGGNTVPTASATITVGFWANPGGAALGGMLTVATTAGVAAFTKVECVRACRGNRGLDSVHVHRAAAPLAQQVGDDMPGDAVDEGAEVVDRLLARLVERRHGARQGLLRSLLGQILVTEAAQRHEAEAVAQRLEGGGIRHARQSTGRGGRR